MKRAQTLLMADAGALDKEISEALPTGTATIYRTKKRFVEGSLEHALSEKPRVGGARKLSGREEALLVATACSEPPTGRAKWTLVLLADEMVALTDHEEISTETIRRRLKENDLKPWQQEMWCIPSVDATFVARMEDVLELYNLRPDPDEPVVCFDETPTQMIGEVRNPVAAEPGQPARYDYEYKRNGTANLFVFMDAHRPWRHVKATARRTKNDFAECMRDLVDIHYPDAERIRVVLDNLNTHTEAALYERFSPAEARRILRRIEFHFTPTHASWLNMVEIEIGVLTRQCLDRRIPDFETLSGEVEAWTAKRNDAEATINWMFDVQQARKKLGKSYPEFDDEATPKMAA